MELSPITIVERNWSI